MRRYKGYVIFFFILEVYFAFQTNSCTSIFKMLRYIEMGVVAKSPHLFLLAARGKKPPKETLMESYV